MNGPSQDIGIASYPLSANVTVDGDSLGITPLIANLSRKGTHSVKIELEGYQPYETTIMQKTSGRVLGNLLFGPLGLVGLGIDFKSGSLYKLTPKQIQVRLADGSILPEYYKILPEYYNSFWNIPPLNRKKIAGEILAGDIGGFIGFVGSFRLGMAVFGEEGWILAAYLAMVGGPIGASFGVYLVGNLGNETGSFNSTMRGSFAGYVGIVGLSLLIPLINDEPANFIPYLALTLTSVGATIGFNRTRRYKITTTESETGLINFRNGRMAFAVPTVSIHPNPFLKGDFIHTIDLIKISL